MERLPLEMIVQIMDYLNLDELADCRLVCKKFLAASYHVQIEDLMLNKSIYKMRFIWFNSLKPKRCEDPISLKKYLTYKTIFNFENNLKRLHLNSHNYTRKINCYENYKFKGDLEDCNLLQRVSPSILPGVLNGLRQLKELKIYSLQGKSDESRDLLRQTNYEIDLPSLEIFVFFGELPFIIDLNAPKLSTIKVTSSSSMNRLLIRQPETVKNLHTVNHLRFGLESFKNLERLFFELDTEQFPRRLFDEADNSKENGVLPIQIVREELINLNFLKGFHLTTNCDFASLHSTFEELKKTLRDIHHQKAAQRGQEFKIYYQGVELVDFNKMDECGRKNTEKKILKFQIKNYDLFQQDLWSLGYLDYRHISKLSKFGNKVVRDHFKNCATIQRVGVDRKPDSKLLNFLNNLNYFEYLGLCITESVNVTTFLEQLRAPKLKGLSIVCKNKNEEITFNGETLFKFKSIFYLHIDVSLDLDLVFSLFKRMNNLKDFNFYYKAKRFHITKQYFHDRFEVVMLVERRLMLVESELKLKYSKYSKVCFDFDLMRKFCNLVVKKDGSDSNLITCSCWHLLKILRFDSDLVGRLLGNFTWYLDMLIDFKKMHRLLVDHLDHFSSNFTWLDRLMDYFKIDRGFLYKPIYVGPPSEMSRLE